MQRDCLRSLHAAYPVLRNPIKIAKKKLIKPTGSPCRPQDLLFSLDAPEINVTANNAHSTKRVIFDILNFD